MKKRWLMTGVVACVALASAGGAYLATKDHYEGLLTQAHPVFASTTAYALLHPILGINLPSDQFSASFPDVRSAVQSIITAEPSGAINRYAFYVRDLNSGNWAGLNESASFDPASLLKVVVAIAVYHHAESDPVYLSEPLTYTPALAQVNQQLAFALPSALKVGQSYTIPYLLKKELADSDNGAVYTLLDSLSDQEISSVYRDLSIPAPNTTDSAGYKLSAREYSRFFRILYGGTMDISWASSEQILEYLSQSTFTTGLAAGVPSGVTVAHKYGEHVNGSGGVASDVELSDCGIVYAPGHPYFLCVMVDGKDPTTLVNVIARVSKVVYQGLGKSRG